MKKVFVIAIFVILAIFLALINLGQAQETNTKMKKEIVKLKYIKTDDIMTGGILSTFLSPQGRIYYNRETGMISVSDYPENVDKILAVIRELDVKPADIQFSIQLVLGSATAEEKSDETLQNDPVIKELRSLLNYKFFTMLDTSLVRAIDREYSQVTMGKDAELKLELRPKYIKEEKEDLIQVETRLRKEGGAVMEKGQISTSSNTLLTSNFTMKSGEKTVVGVSKMDGGDKGLILIISGKIIK